MNDRLILWLRFKFAQLLTILGLRGRVIEQLEGILRDAPHYAAAWRYLGFLRAQRDERDAAIRAFQEALRLDPGDDTTRFNLGYLFHTGRRWREAIAEFERVVKTSPSNDRAWYGLGLCREQLGDREQAVAALKEAARLQYFNPHAAYHLVHTYHKLGRGEEARAEYERVKSFDPKVAEQIRRETGIG